jgi:glycine cleavage system H protein
LFSVPATGCTPSTQRPALDGAPEALNRDPYGEGWILRLKPSDPAEAGALMDAAAYTALTA